MTGLALQKAAALALSILAGFLLRKKFRHPAAVGAIRAFVLNAALPATIFLSIANIEADLNLLFFPAFALAVNFALAAIGFGLVWAIVGRSDRPKARMLALLFPSLAPGLTVFPFVEQFAGPDALALSALADLGNKLFVLIGLYVLAIAAYRRSVRLASGAEAALPWQGVVKFLATEPVNIAIAAALVLAVTGIPVAALPFALTDAIAKFAACSTPLILFYVGISLKRESFRLGPIAATLLVRSGVGFALSGLALAALPGASPAETAAIVAFPQASCSLWPLLHATNINDLHARRLAEGGVVAMANGAAVAGESAGEGSDVYFDAEFAVATLAVSFPFSVFLLLGVFSSGGWFFAPGSLAIAAIAMLVLGGVAAASCAWPLRVRSPLSVRWQAPVSRPAGAAIAPEVGPDRPDRRTSRRRPPPAPPAPVPPPAARSAAAQFRRESPLETLRERTVARPNSVRARAKPPVPPPSRSGPARSAPSRPAPARSIPPQLVADALRQDEWPARPGSNGLAAAGMPPVASARGEARRLETLERRVRDCLQPSLGDRLGSLSVRIARSGDRLMVTGQHAPGPVDDADDAFDRLERACDPATFPAARHWEFRLKLPGEPPYARYVMRPTPAGGAAPAAPLHHRAGEGLGSLAFDDPAAGSDRPEAPPPPRSTQPPGDPSDRPPAAIDV